MMNLLPLASLLLSRPESTVALVKGAGYEGRHACTTLQSEVTEDQVAYEKREREERVVYKCTASQSPRSPRCAPSRLGCCATSRVSWSMRDRVRQNGAS